MVSGSRRWCPSPAAVLPQEGVPPLGHHLTSQPPQPFTGPMLFISEVVMSGTHLHDGSFTCYRSHHLLDSYTDSTITPAHPPLVTN